MRETRKPETDVICDFIKLTNRYRDRHVILVISDPPSDLTTRHFLRYILLGTYLQMRSCFTQNQSHNQFCFENILVHSLHWAK